MHLLGLSSLYFAAYRLKTSSICAGLPRVVHHVAGAQTLRRTASARSAPTTSGRKVRRLSSYISADPMIVLAKALKLRCLGDSLLNSNLNLS